MSYGSFYGGRQGNSFVLVKSYPDVPSMVTDFKKGNNFSQVKYDEYVIINAYNKNCNDNGKIFRRGYDYNSDRQISYSKPYKLVDGEEVQVPKADCTEEGLKYAFYKTAYIDAGGAIQIATIVGPQGKSPMLTLKSYEDFPSNQGNSNLELTSSGEFSIDNESLVSGRNNDKILWKSHSHVDDQKDQGIAQVGLQIPYPVIDFSLNTDPYATPGVTRVYAETEGENENNIKHPFYHNWQFTIPSGKRGNDIKSIKKINLSSYLHSGNQNIYYIDNMGNEEAISYSNLSTLGLEEDDDILIYQYQKYNTRQGEVKLYYIGKYKQIENIEVENETGDLKIYYTDESSVLFEKVFSKITELSYNEEREDGQKGILKISYNTGEFKEIPINYIDKIKLNETGLLSYKTNTEGDEVLDSETHELGKIKWINNITYDRGTNDIIITYNTSSQEDPSSKDIVNVPFVADLRIEPDGKAEIKYNGSDAEWTSIRDKNNNETILTWIEDIQYDISNDRLLIYYNTYKTDSETGQRIPDVIIENPFNKIKKIEFFQDLDFIDEITSETIYKPGFQITYGNNDVEKVSFSGGKLIQSQNGIVIEEGVNVETGENTRIIKINYSDGSQQELTTFLYPMTVKVNDNTITDSHQIQFFNNQGDIMVESKPITGIEKVQIENNKLLVLYNNPTARDNIVASNQVQKGNYIWENLGTVRTDSGILVGKNITPSEIKEGLHMEQEESLTEENIISYLNDTYSDGEIVSGVYKIITVGEEFQNKKFYGFDIGDVNGNNSSWYLLGSIPQAASQVDCVCGTIDEFQSIGDIKKSTLSLGGLYFIVEED